MDVTLNINQNVSQEFIGKLINDEKNLLYCNDIYLQTNNVKSTLYTNTDICEPTFDTYIQIDDNWKYCGQCFAGEFFDSKKYLIDFNYEIMNDKNITQEYFNGFETLANAFIYCKKNASKDNLKIFTYPIDIYNNFKELNSSDFSHGILIYDSAENMVVPPNLNSYQECLSGSLFNEIISKIELYNENFKNKGMEYIETLSNNYINNFEYDSKYEIISNTEMSISEYLSLIGLETKNNIRQLDELKSFLNSNEMYLDSYTTHLQSFIITNKIPTVKVLEQPSESELSYQDIRLFEIPESCINKVLDISNNQTYYDIAKIIIENSNYYYNENQINDLQIAIGNDIRSGNVTYLQSEVENILASNPLLDNASRKSLLTFSDKLNDITSSKNVNINISALKK